MSREYSPWKSEQGRNWGNKRWMAHPVCREVGAGCDLRYIGLYRYHSDGTSPALDRYTFGLSPGGFEKYFKKRGRLIQFSKTVVLGNWGNAYYFEELLTVRFR